MARILEQGPATGSVESDDARPEETKADCFRRLARKRVEKALDYIRIVGNLSNRSIYEYSDEQVDKIEAALLSEIDMIMRQFRKEKKQKKTFEI